CRARRSHDRKIPLIDAVDTHAGRAVFGIAVGYGARRDKKPEVAWRHVAAVEPIERVGLTDSVETTDFSRRRPDALHTQSETLRYAAQRCRHLRGHVREERARGDEVCVHDLLARADRNDARLFEARRADEIRFRG